MHSIVCGVHNIMCSMQSSVCSIESVVNSVPCAKFSVVVLLDHHVDALVEVN